MTRIFRFWRTGGFLVTSLLLATSAIPTAAGEPDLALGLPAPDRLSDLAESGRFSEVLVRLKDDFVGIPHAGVENLISDLARFEQKESQRAQQRLEAYGEGVEKIAAELEGGRLEEALIAAIDAHNLAEDPGALLSHPNVRRLVARADQAARQAEQDHDWVEAMSLYRTLDLLFDDKNTYRQPLRRISQHLRILRIYAPAELLRLYRAMAERRAANGDEQEIIFLEPEKWQTQLKDIKLRMLKDSLEKAAAEHVGRVDHTEMMRGAVDGLLLMLSTRGLAQSFPQIEDEKNLRRFRDHLNVVSAKLKALNRKVGSLEAELILDKIIRLNKKTLDFPERVIVFELTEGAIDQLDDFSAVIWPAQLEHFSRSTRGKFTGVGIQIARKINPKLGRHEILVVTPLANTPARRAGITAGDIITHVNGTPTIAWPLDRAVREITGPPGTVVKLKVRRKNGPEDLEFDIVRSEIKIESVRGWQLTDDEQWDFWIDRDAGIGYIRLSQFIPQSADDLDDAVTQMLPDGPINGLIFDLRFNPGGLLESAIDVADRFVEEGLIVATVNAAGKTADKRFAKTPPTYQRFPVVVLINQGSASASEIIAGALQDHGRALVVGARSYGKGSVQDLFPVAYGRAYLKLTTHYYRFPRGRTIHRHPGDKQWGIEPNLLVDMTNEQTKKMIELRQELDVLRDEQLPPVTVDPEPEGQPQPAMAEASPRTDPAHTPPPDTQEGPAAERSPRPQAADILTLGRDPQLETALMVLKTRLVAQHIAMARKDEALATP